jgi:hypothetical protein
MERRSSRWQRHASVRWENANLACVKTNRGYCLRLPPCGSECFAPTVLRLLLTGARPADSVFRLVKRTLYLTRAIVETLDQVGGHVSAEARRGRL